MTERWLPVRGYEGLYEVSDRGNVRSVDRIITLQDGRTQPWPSRPLRPASNPGRNHLRVTLSRSGRGKRIYVHKLVLEAFVGPRPAGMEACHNNGVGSDNRLENLRWDTRSANMLDQVRHGVHHEAMHTHCPRGHLLAGANLDTHLLRRGTRRCLACRRASSAKSKAKRLGREFDFGATADANYVRFSA